MQQHGNREGSDPTECGFAQSEVTAFRVLGFIILRVEKTCYYRMAPDAAHFNEINKIREGLVRSVEIRYTIKITLSRAE